MIMKQKDIKKLSQPLRDERVPHLLLARSKGGVNISCVANEDDICDFLQVMIDKNPVVLDIMEDIIESRKRPKSKENTIIPS